MNKDTRIQTFLAAYMNKSASVGDLMTSLGERGADLAEKAAFLAPLGLGAVGGVLASKLTSPNSSDKVLQQALVTRELEEALAELQRRKALALIETQARSKDVKPKRSLHI